MSDGEQRAELVVGETLDGKYQLQRLLGVGGMGAVYLATRLPLGDEVALKTILGSQNTEQNRARFLREARAAASIHHPNVVQVFDFGQPSNRPPYMVMELLDGPTLASVIDASAPLPAERALVLFASICAAVEAGHRRGVVHRDLKPGNVIIARTDDGREVVKVLDFGLARVAGLDASQLTSPGAMVGTCSYMAPELIESGDATPASDVFALGVLLYEMVIGRSPFKAATNAATILRISEAEYDRPGSVNKDLPAPLCAGIEAALGREPGDRPQSPEQLAALVGAPLPSSASDASRTELGLEDASAVGGPGDLEPSLVQSPSPAAGEITLSDQGVNQHGGEKTVVGEAAAYGLDVPRFVGRALELEALRREFKAVVDGRGRVVVVTGDAGVGKSRLADAFAHWARSQGVVTIRGRFFAYEGDRPPPYETYQWMLSQARSGGAAGQLARANQPGEADRPALSGDKWQAFAAMADAFRDQASGKPQIVIVDDLQWATALDLEFLTFMHRNAGGSPTMVLGTARQAGVLGDDELGRWMARLGAQRALLALALERFGTSEVRDWFQAVFPGIRIRPQDVRRLQHATSGNPFYLSEVVRQLVDEGRIRRDEHGQVCEPLDTVVLPETVHAVVRAKLGGLGEALRLVLEMACVVGEEFRFETLRAALSAEEEELESILEDATARGLLSEQALTPGSDYRFESTTLRSVLYGSLSKRRRLRLHRAVVAALESLYEATDGDRVAKVLTYHYHAIGDHPQTAAWGLRAGRECMRQHDTDTAELALRRARAAAQHLGGATPKISAHDLAELDRLTGALYVRLGRLREAEELLMGALRRLADDPEPSLQLRTLLDLASCQLGRGEFEAGLATGRRAIEAASQLSDAAGEMAARVHAARCAAPQGALDEAQSLLEPVVDAIATMQSDPARLEPVGSTLAMASAELGWVHAKRGGFQKAEASASRGLELARRVGDVLAEYRSVSVLGLTYLESGDQTQAVRSLQWALDLARRLSLRRREGVELHNLGEAYYFLGRYEDGLRTAREALAIAAEVHDRATAGDIRVNLGRMLAASGNVDEARPMLEHGLALAEECGRTEYEGLALCGLAELDLESGDLASARERYERAKRRFERSGSLYLWRAEIGLAKQAAATGDPSRGRPHAAAAREHLEQIASNLSVTMDRRSIESSLASVKKVQSDLTTA